MKTETYVLVGIIAVVALGIGYFSGGAKDMVVGGSGSGSQADACTASTSVVTILSTASRSILATTSNRAYARIQQPLNATNTVTLVLNDAPVTATSPGVLLENASTTVGNTEYAFGLATDFPYTGAIAASSSAGTASVIVTQCIY